MRTSDNHYQDNRLIDGYDYDNQAWVKDGRYLRCGHPDTMPCNCYGKQHEGEETKQGERKSFWTKDDSEAIAHIQEVRHQIAILENENERNTAAFMKLNGISNTKVFETIYNNLKWQ